MTWRRLPAWVREGVRCGRGCLVVRGWGNAKKTSLGDKLIYKVAVPPRRACSSTIYSLSLSSLFPPSFLSQLFSLSLSLCCDVHFHACDGSSRKCQIKAKLFFPTAMVAVPTPPPLALSAPFSSRSRPFLDTMIGLLLSSSF